VDVLIVTLIRHWGRVAARVGYEVLDALNIDRDCEEVRSAFTISARAEVTVDQLQISTLFCVTR